MQQQQPHSLFDDMVKLVEGLTAPENPLTTFKKKSMENH